MTEIRTVTTLVAQGRRNRSRDCRLRGAPCASSRGPLARQRGDLDIRGGWRSGLDDGLHGYSPSLQRGELTAICKAALGGHGPMDTRALVTHILAAKGLDGGDRVLAKSVAERLIHALRMQAKRGKIRIVGKEKGAIVCAQH